jgi:hypothetical protein
MYSCKFAIKLPRKRKSLTVQGDFDKIDASVKSTSLDFEALPLFLRRFSDFWRLHQDY